MKNSLQGFSSKSVVQEILKSKKKKKKLKSILQAGIKGQW